MSNIPLVGFEQEGGQDLNMFKSWCVPLANLLFASQVIDETIDLLVLDMAYTDMDILDTALRHPLPHIQVSMHKLNISI